MTECQNAGAEDPPILSNDDDLTNSLPPANEPVSAPDPGKPPKPSKETRGAAAKAAAMLKASTLSLTSMSSTKRKRRDNRRDLEERPTKLLPTRVPDIPMPQLTKSIVPKEKIQSNVPKLAPIGEDPPEIAGRVEMKLFFIDRNRNPMDYKFEPPKQTVS